MCDVYINRNKRDQQSCLILQQLMKSECHVKFTQQGKLQ